MPQKNSPRELSTPNSLRQAHTLIEEIRKTQKFELFDEFFQVLILHIQTQARSLRCRYKPNSPEHLAEQVFEPSFDYKMLKSRVIDEFSTVLYVLGKLKDEVNSYASEGNSDQLQVYADLLRELVFEFIMYESDYYTEVKKLNVYYGFVKRMAPNSTEVFNCSRMLLEERIYANTISQFSVRPTSVFLIRQAIELRLKNALGIHLILDSNGKLIPISSEKFLKLIEPDSRNIHFPVKKSILTKVHKWTQLYVHGGYIPHIWLIIFAHHLIQPLFEWGEGLDIKDNRGVNSMHGAIKMSRQFFDSIPELIATEILNTTVDQITVIRQKHPECVIMDDTSDDNCS